jgi:hypothetical protein
MLNRHPDFRRLVEIAQVRARVEDQLMRLGNVVGVGIGFKSVDGQFTPIPSIVVSVIEKLPRRALFSRDVVPDQVEDVITDVVETGIIRPLSENPRTMLRPAPSGASIGHRDGTAGTMGALVTRDGETFILSNNHVLALLNTGQPGDAILQPAPADGGDPNKHRIGDLAGFVPIRFAGEDEPAAADDDRREAEPAGCAAILLRLLGRRFPAIMPGLETALQTNGNAVDAALARPYDDLLVDSRILELGGSPTGIVDPALNMTVYKSGRTSGVTMGRITQVDVTATIQYGNRTARYVNQIMTTPISERGDSGSLVVNEDRAAVGLLFSGSDVVSVVSPIRFVLSALRAELVTG